VAAGIQATVSGDVRGRGAAASSPTLVGLKEKGLGGGMPARRWGGRRAALGF